MVRTIRARFSGGVFEPLEGAAAEMIREGQEVLIMISTEPTALTDDPIRDTAGGWKDLIDADSESITRRLEELRAAGLVQAR